MTQNWFDDGNPFPIGLMGDVQPDEILYDYDWPITFTLRTKLGVFLAHLATEADGVRTHVAVPADQSTVTRLKSGALSVRSAFDQPLVWIIAIDVSWQLVGAWTMAGISHLNADALPDEGVMLYPELEPLLRVRLKGVLTEYGHLNADVVRSLVVRVQKSLRGLAAYAIQEASKATGYMAPIERLLELRTQQFAFRSLEIAFREPEREEIEAKSDSIAEVDMAYETMARVKSLLETGLNWTLQNAEFIGKGDDEERAILRAIRQLVPAAGEDEVELSGRLVSREAGKPLTLAKRERSRIAKELRRLRNHSYVTIVVRGVIDELDRGKYTFILRHTDVGVEKSFRYSASMADEVRAAFLAQTYLRLSGTSKVDEKIIELTELKEEKGVSGFPSDIVTE